jgi:hypothetical protein
MGRIANSALRRLADQWSPIIHELLHNMGTRQWPPLKQRQSLFGKPVLISRYNVGGPVERDGQLVWALSHTSRPSSFDERGILSQGERQFWLVTLQSDDPLRFRIEGASAHHAIAATIPSLREALIRAERDGPKVEAFYGNKGPLHHR